MPAVPLGTVDLSGTDLYTSCEPCALCVAAMTIAGVERLYYAATMEDAGAAFDGLTSAMRHPIDARLLRAECAAPVHARRLPAEQGMAAEAAEILARWAAARRDAH